MINLHSPSLSTVKTDQDTQCENRVVEWVQIDNCFNRNFSEQDEFKPENKASINEIMGGKLKWRKQLIKQLEKTGKRFSMCCCVFICFLNSRVQGSTKFSFWSNISNGYYSKFPTVTNIAEIADLTKLCLHSISEDITGLHPLPVPTLKRTEYLHHTINTKYFPNPNSSAQPHM